MLLLDTSFIIHLFKNPEKVEEWLDRIDREGAATTAISYFEIFRKKHKMSRSESVYLNNFFNSYPVLPFDSKSAEKAADLLGRLERAGEVINVLDSMIVGIMLSNGIKSILTADTDFKKAAKYSEVEVVEIDP